MINNFSHPINKFRIGNKATNPLSSSLWQDEITRKLDFGCAVYIFRMENSLIDSGSDEYVFVFGDDDDEEEDDRTNV